MRTNCRPKHQTLILRCYPKILKNAADATANPSELSYLMYYCSTRRSKLQKVGLFLERRAAKDVYKKHVGQIQVTLEICRSLIEKCPRDLNVYASSILTILTTVLKSKDINLTEETLPCFEVFCANHDGSILSSDEQYIKQFEEIIKLYASCADTQPPAPGQELRWKSIGLKAIKSISCSEALSAVNAKQQLAIVVPVVLQNLYSEDDDHLHELQHQMSNQEEEEKVELSRRMSIVQPRMSIAQPRQSMATLEGAMANTAADADILEMQDIELLALQSLKCIFEVNSVPQIRSAVAAMVEYVSMRERLAETWATQLVEMVARWTQVQYRFIILVEMMENLVVTPMMESALRKQLVLAQLISWLLSSTVNLVGLSIMDILVSIIAKIMQLLQLERKHVEPPSQPSIQQSNTITAIFQMTSTITEVAKTPSSTRIQLLKKLKRCIADLATHIYYSDQIVDICQGLLVRLKPSSNMPVTTDPAVAGSAVGNLTEQQNVDDFFSFDTARAVALQSVKELIIVANQQNQSGVGRNTVPLDVWDGTYWLLNDEDKTVRMSYIDAFCTYLRIELNRQDPASEVTVTIAEANELKITNRSNKLLNSSFLKLLHVAIYETALCNASSTQDIVAIFDLLSCLVQKIGLPAMISGIPMIFRLQDDINYQTDDKARLALPTLIAGYLGVVAERLNLTEVSQDIHDTIDERKERGQWFRAIAFPGSEGDAYVEEKMPYRSEKPIEPITNRQLLVKEMCQAYISHDGETYFPQKMRDQLLMQWTKESVISSVEANGSHSASLRESGAPGRHGTVRSYLSANGHRTPTSRPKTGVYNLPALSQSEKFHKDRTTRRSLGSKSATNVSISRSSSSRESTVRANELKAVLSSGASIKRPHTMTGIGMAGTSHAVSRSMEKSGNRDQSMGSDSSGSPLDNDDESFASLDSGSPDESRDGAPPLPASNLADAVIAKLNNTRSSPRQNHSLAIKPAPATPPETSHSLLHKATTPPPPPLHPEESFKAFMFFDTDPNTAAANAENTPKNTWWEGASSSNAHDNVPDTVSDHSGPAPENLGMTRRLSVSRQPGANPFNVPLQTGRESMASNPPSTAPGNLGPSSSLGRASGQVDVKSLLMGIGKTGTGTGGHGGFKPPY